MPGLDPDAGPREQDAFICGTTGSYFHSSAIAVAERAAAFIREDG